MPINILDVLTLSGQNITDYNDCISTVDAYLNSNTFSCSQDIEIDLNKIVLDHIVMFKLQQAYVNQGWYNVQYGGINGNLTLKMSIPCI